MSETAAVIIRAARLRAALSQTELAAHAGVAQSVISTYESGDREPSFSTLKKLVAAAGFDIALTIEASEPGSPLRALVDARRERLVRSLRKLGARNVRIFGSVARGDDGPESDVDLLVDIAPEVGLFALGQMRSEAESILGVGVDVVPANSLKEDVAERVLAEAIAL